MNFKYCLWLIPIKDHIWNTYTNGFNPHITIKSHLNFNEAVSLYNSIKKEPIDVTIVYDQKYDIKNNFHALYYNVTPNKYLKWWPENAHISFMYDYNYIPVTIRKKIHYQIKELHSQMYDIKIANCNGHFINWNFI